MQATRLTQAVVGASSHRSAAARTAALGPRATIRRRGCVLAAFRLLLLVLTVGGLVAVEGSRAAEVTANTRVRAGPGRASQTITVLPEGSPISVLGRSEDGRWLRIACPEGAYVWVHRRNLVATDDPRILRVITPGTHVRADSRIQAPVLARLAEGQLVTWVGSERDGLFLGRRVADWYGVRVDSLPVYVHADLVRWRDTAPLAAVPVTTAHGTPTAGSTPRERPGRPPVAVPADLEALWADCRQRYESFRQRLLADVADGFAQPWLQLQVDLQRVVEHHPRVRTRLLAQRLDSRIDRLLRHAELLRARGLPVAGAVRQLPPTERQRPSAAFDQGVRSAMSLAAEADERAAAAASTPAGPPVAPDAPADGVTVAPATDSAPPAEAAAPPTRAAPAIAGTVEAPPPSEPQRSAAALAPDDPPATEASATEAPSAAPAVPEPAPAAVPPADAPALDGWLIEEQVPDQAVHHVLKNQQGELVGLLKMPADSQIQLSDYRWQHVIVRGLPQQVEVTYDGRRQQVTLVTVTDIDKVP